MRRIFIILIAVLCVLYIWSYYRIPSEVTILQTSLNEFQFDMLREKQPIVIDDRVPKYDEIWRLWFPQNMVTAFGMQHDGTWLRNHYKYLLVHAQVSGEVLLYSAGKKMIDGAPDPQQQLLAIHLEPNQIAIIPRRYHVHIPANMSVAALGIHDYVTVLLP